MKTYYAVGINEYQHMNNETLKQNFVITNLFAPDEFNVYYTHYDRNVIAGCQPVNQKIIVDNGNLFNQPYFLTRREMGIINIGGLGQVIVDDQTIEIDKNEALYVPMGAKVLTFISKNINQPALFYINCAPAHSKYQLKKITETDIKVKHLGDQHHSNERKIMQLIHPDYVQTNQLCMGVTILQNNSMWNTMPCHTHERRMEAYLYYDLPVEDVVIHLMGTVNETRSLIMRNRQAVLAPPWSIHCGVGTASYSFIWGMAGEDFNWDDMQIIKPADLQ